LKNEKLSLTCYLTSKYENNSNNPAMQKRTQSKPNYIVFISVHSWLNSKQISMPIGIDEQGIWAYNGWSNEKQK
jgi:hypothetical protein